MHVPSYECDDYCSISLNPEGCSAYYNYECTKEPVGINWQSYCITERERHVHKQAQCSLPIKKIVAKLKEEISVELIILFVVFDNAIGR